MSKRSNQYWLKYLRDTSDPQKQKLAHQELGNYINKEAHDYLMRKHVLDNPNILSKQELKELSAWPEQVAQETLEKLTGNHFALLDEFESRLMSEEKVSFLNWAASLVVFDELRGEHGLRRQELALKNLGANLYDTVYYYLCRRQAKANPYALANLASNELAELALDLAQDTYAKLIGKECAVLNTFKAKARFTTWLAAIAVNQARQELRRPYWEKRTVSTQDESPDASSRLEELTPTEEGDEPEGKTIGKEHEIEQRELEKDLHLCIENLSNDHQVVILGRFFENQSGEDLHKELNRSIGAVHSLTANAKGKLRKCLERKGWKKRDVLQILAKRS